MSHYIFFLLSKRHRHCGK